MIGGVFARLARVRFTVGYVAILLAISCAILALGPHTHDVIVQRGQEHITLKITPQLKDGGGKIGVTPIEKVVPVGMREALSDSVRMPFEVVQELVSGLARIITGKEKPDFKGPVGIVKETSKAAERSSMSAARTTMSTPSWGPITPM